MVSAGVIPPLLGETGAHTLDSLVRVAVGIGDVEVWQRALDFLSFGAFQVSEREWAGEAYFARYHIERMVLLQASHVREVIHSPSVVRL